MRRSRELRRFARRRPRRGRESPLAALAATSGAATSCRGSAEPSGEDVWPRSMPYRYAWATACHAGACALCASASQCYSPRRRALRALRSAGLTFSRAASPPSPRARPSRAGALTPAGLPQCAARGRKSAIASCSRRCSRASARAPRARHPRAADDDGLELAPSPFWHEVVKGAGRCRRRSRRRRLAHVLDGHDERERLQAIAALARQRRARGPGARQQRTGAAPSQRVERALASWRRPTRLREPLRARGASRRRKPTAVTELETFQTCSSLWFVERQAAPARHRAAARSARRRHRDAQRPAALLRAGAASELRVSRAAPWSIYRPPSTCSTAASTRPSRSSRTTTTTSPGRRCAESSGAICARLAPAPRRTGSTSSSRGDLQISLPATGVLVGGVPITGRIDRCGPARSGSPRR